MTSLPPTPAQRRILWLALTGLAVAVILALIGGAVWSLGWLLDVLSPVLWPLAVAAVIACVVSPVVDWLEKRKVPRTRAILLVFAGVFLLGAGALASLIPQAVIETRQLVVKIPEYSTQLQNRLADLIAQPPEIVRQFLPAPQPADSAATATEKQQALTQAFGWLGKHGSGVGSWFLSQAEKIISGFGVLAGLGLVPVYAFYLLLETRQIKDRWQDYLPVRDSALKEELVFVLDAVKRYLIAFFRGQVLVALCDSVLYTLGFIFVARLNYAILLGFAAVALSMIPFLGALVLCLTALALALVQYGDWLHPLLILCVFAVVQVLEGFVISPKIIGDRVGLHPLVIIIAVMTGTTLLGGILGGILAIPLAAALRVILFRYVWKVRES